MKRKLLLFFALASMSIFARAAEPEALIITLSDSSVETVLLDEIREITFNETATQAIICKLDNNEIVIGLDNVEEATFNHSTATILPTLLLEQNPTQKVIENGQLYIVKDGVRYNVLGIRFN